MVDCELIGPSPEPGAVAGLHCGGWSVFPVNESGDYEKEA